MIFAAFKLKLYFLSGCDLGTILCEIWSTVIGILCRFFTAYFIAYRLNVNFSILINIWNREESSVCLLRISRNHVVSVRRGFFFLLVLGQDALFCFGPPWAIKQLKVQILGTY